MGVRKFFTNYVHLTKGVYADGGKQRVSISENPFTTWSNTNRDFLNTAFSCESFRDKGKESFNQAAHFMESLPFRYALEIFIIFLPIVFHAIYGLYIAFTAKTNVNNYGFFRNWMFILQRVSGVITLIFITWHVWETRIQAALGKVDFQMMERILSNPAMFAFYIVGVVSTIFHFANGLWSFGVSWG